MTAQAPAPGLHVMAVPPTLIRLVTCVNDTVGARFRLRFDDPTVNDEAINKGVKAQKYVIAFGDKADDGGAIDNVILKTAKGDVLLWRNQLAKDGFTLTMDSASQWTIKGAAGTPLPREIDVIGGFSKAGTNTVTLRAEVTPLGAAAAAMGQAQAVGVIVSEETLFLRDLGSTNFSVDPPRPTDAVLVCADANRNGGIYFGTVCADMRKNVEYDWSIGRPVAAIREGVFNLKKGYTATEEKLRPGVYTLVLKKKVDGKVQDFTRQIDFRVVSVELNVQGVPANDKRRPGAYIPLNGGNVNKSKTTFGIPDKYDFEVSPLPKASRLFKAALSITAGILPKNVTVRLDVANEGRARIRVWDTPKKDNEIVLPKDWDAGKVPDTVWIEGVKEGAAERETMLSLQLVRDKNVLCSDTTAITVTPVLEVLRMVASKNSAPDLRFNARIGGPILDSQAGNPDFVTMTLAARALRTNLGGELRFVQFTRNVNNLKDGFGADLGGGDRRKWDFEKASAGKWLLDSKRGDVPFFATGEEHPNTTRDFDRVLAEDSPALPVGQTRAKTRSVLPDKGKKTEIDVSFEFTTFAVWQFSDGTVYFLGEANWNIRFAGVLTPDPDPKSELGYKYAKGEKNKNTGSGDMFRRNNDRHLDPKGSMVVKEPVANDADPNWR
ncbi:MAG: hypothetical protein K2R98_28565 [Gemmataceae bacterium]|nr:hypothetical protein [Gemmataceae bacterium]